MIVCSRCLRQGRVRRLHYDRPRNLFTCVETHILDGVRMAGHDIHGPQHTGEAVVDFLRHPRACYPDLTA